MCKKFGRILKEASLGMLEKNVSSKTSSLRTCLSISGSHTKSALHVTMLNCWKPSDSGTRKTSLSYTYWWSHHAPIASSKFRSTSVKNLKITHYSSIRRGEVYGKGRPLNDTSFHSRGSSVCFVYTFSQDKKAMFLFQVWGTKGLGFFNILQNHRDKKSREKGQSCKVTSKFLNPSTV